MSTATVKRRTSKPLHLSPDDNGLELTLQEFTAAEFEEGWRYELINGVLVVSPRPSASERDPNDELGTLLRVYKRTHPQGHVLLSTLPEQYVQTKRAMRAADRVIWIGPPRIVEEDDLPTIVIEIPSKRRRDQRRDYETKREEYVAIGVKEYWIIDRHQRAMTVFILRGSRIVEKHIQADELYTTPLLPGFELPLKQLLECADRWKPKGKKRN